MTTKYSAPPQYRGLISETVRFTGHNGETIAGLRDELTAARTTADAAPAGRTAHRDSRPFEEKRAVAVAITPDRPRRQDCHG